MHHCAYTLHCHKLLDLLIVKKPYLLSVILSLNWIHSTASSSCECVVKFGILAEPTGIAQEWVLLVIVDCSVEQENQLISLVIKNINEE